MTMVAGCSTPMVAPSDLKASARPSTLQLSVPIVYKAKQGLGVEREYVLSAGSYKGIGESGDGVWYLGSPQSLRVTITDSGGAIALRKEQIGVPMYSAGGLYVPKDVTQVPQVFDIYDGNAAKLPSMAGRSENPPEATSAALTQLSSSAVNANSSVVASGVSAGVAGGVVAGIIALDKADWGKYQILGVQPPADAKLREKFTIISSE